jgi:hypothetical protein
MCCPKTVPPFIDMGVFFGPSLNRNRLAEMQGFKKVESSMEG